MDSAEVLEATEEAFDAVALFVGLGVVGVWVLASRIRRDDGLAALSAQPIAQRTGVIGPVGEQATGCAGDGEQVPGTGEIVGVAGCQRERERSALAVGQRVNFGGTTTARAPDRIAIGPPFAPPAERCALTCMLSIEAMTPPITPVDPASA